MKSLIFFNNKGGVGKTTLLCNIASYLSIYENLKILIIDADPQCNATQYMFPERKLQYFYEDTSTFTINNIVRPLSLGKGYSKELNFFQSERFCVDVIPGDPRLALTEDLLARDWGSAVGGDPRGIRTSLLFAELLQRCSDYDLVFFDVGPSLGSINRAVLLAADFFVAPMSIDIFSVKAIDNISEWLSRWTRQWDAALSNAEEDDDIERFDLQQLRFLGYVSQQYIAKKESTGSRRAVNAYDRIMSQFDSIIKEKLIHGTEKNPFAIYDLGSIPNLHSLIPMSQSSRTPIFELKAMDGVRGAHFSKVKEAKEIFGEIARLINSRISKA